LLCKRVGASAKNFRRAVAGQPDGVGNRLLFTAPNGLDAEGFRNDMELFAASMK